MYHVKTPEGMKAIHFVCKLCEEKISFADEEEAIFEDGSVCMGQERSYGGQYCGKSTVPPGVYAIAKYHLKCYHYIQVSNELAHKRWESSKKDKQNETD